MERKTKIVDWKVDENGCWICTSHCRTEGGYPRIRYKGKHWLLHRLVYAKLKGEIPEGYVVRHTCDNRACIHPDHLVIGTQADNLRDMVERGRSAHGASNGNHKLTEKDVRAILADTQHTQAELGKMFGVNQGQISYIKNRKTWKHIVMETIL